MLWIPWILALSLKPLKPCNKHEKSKLDSKLQSISGKTICKNWIASKRSITLPSKLLLVLWENPTKNASSAGMICKVGLGSLSAVSTKVTRNAWPNTTDQIQIKLICAQWDVKPNDLQSPLLYVHSHFFFRINFKIILLKINLTA